MASVRAQARKDRAHDVDRDHCHSQYQYVPLGEAEEWARVDRLVRERAEHEPGRGHPEGGRRRAEHRDGPDPKVGDDLVVEQLGAGTALAGVDEAAPRLLRRHEHGDPGRNVVQLLEPGAYGPRERVGRRLGDVDEREPRRVGLGAGPRDGEHGQAASLARGEQIYLGVDVVDCVNHVVGAPRPAEDLLFGLPAVHRVDRLDGRLWGDARKVLLEARRLGRADVFTSGQTVSVQRREGDLVKVDEPEAADAGAEQHVRAVRADAAQPHDHDERVRDLLLALETEELDVPRELLGDDVVVKERRRGQSVWSSRALNEFVLGQRRRGGARRADGHPVEAAERDDDAGREAGESVPRGAHSQMSQTDIPCFEFSNSNSRVGRTERSVRGFSLGFPVFSELWGVGRRASEPL